MIGHYEISDEEKAKTKLREAAAKYAGTYLKEGFGGSLDVASHALEDAAMAYAATQARPRKKKAKVMR